VSELLSHSSKIIIYPFKFYSNFTNKNVSWLHFSWAIQCVFWVTPCDQERASKPVV